MKVARLIYLPSAVSNKSMFRHTDLTAQNSPCSSDNWPIERKSILLSMQDQQNSGSDIKGTKLPLFGYHCLRSPLSNAFTKHRYHFDLNKKADALNCTLNQEFIQLDEPLKSEVVQLLIPTGIDPKFIRQFNSNASNDSTPIKLFTLTSKCDNPASTKNLIGAIFFSTESHSIFSLSVHKDYQSKGYGRYLLACAIQTIARSSTSRETIYLSTDESRSHAIALYDKAGSRYEENNSVFELTYDDLIPEREHQSNYTPVTVSYRILPNSLKCKRFVSETLK